MVYNCPGGDTDAVWDRYDAFDALRSGKVAAVRVDIRDGDAYLFYKVNLSTLI